MGYPHAAGIVAVSLLTAGCASVVDGATQTITVATAPVSGAACTVSNARGSWSVVSPGSAVIKKSESVLAIVCKLDGYDDGKFYAAGKMSTASLVGTMLPYVGVISSAVDASTGAVLTYPDSYLVQLKPLPPTPKN